MAVATTTPLHNWLRTHLRRVLAHALCPQAASKISSPMITLTNTTLLPLLPANATPATLSLHAPLNFQPQHLHHQHSSSCLPSNTSTASRPPKSVQHHPKISRHTFHLGSNHSSSQPTLPHHPSWPPTPDRRCSRPPYIKQDL
jgi:hypothetical protein